MTTSAPSLISSPAELEKYENYSPWRLLLTKCFDRERYYLLKDARKRARRYRSWAEFNNLGFKLQHSVPSGRATIFKHSGNAGDVIYALPTVRCLSGDLGAQLNLELNVPLRATGLNHPLGRVMLDEAMFDKLKPLLATQSYIHSVERHRKERVDYDLDAFRDAPLPLDRLGISRWYFYFFGVTADLAKPWLTVQPDRLFAGRIVLARSFRYRNWALDYRFLRRFGKAVFVGLEEEYRDMKAQLPQLEWFPVSDFLQLAQVIAGCRLFIGNQSFPFALAEALKVPRVLETDPESPNVVPTGERAFDVLFQRQFEHVVAELMHDRDSP